MNQFGPTAKRGELSISPETAPADVRRESTSILSHAPEETHAAQADPFGQQTKGVLAPIRACANCEAEAGILDRADATKSHGLCRRHYVTTLIEAGLSSGEAWLKADELSPSAFCPDLKAGRLKTAQALRLAEERIA